MPLPRFCRRRAPSVVAELAAYDALSRCRLCAIAVYRCPTGVQPGLAGQSCTSEGAMDPRESVTPGVMVGVFAALEAFCRRVVGVSRLYWCNSPRLVAPSTWGELDRAPLTQRNSPRLVAPSTWGELDRAPLTQRNSPRLVAVRSRFGVVRSWFGAAWCPKCRPPRRNTSTMGCRGRGGLRCGHNGAWPRVELAREPAIACANRLYRT